MVQESNIDHDNNFQFSHCLHSLQNYVIQIGLILIIYCEESMGKESK